MIRPLFTLALAALLLGGGAATASAQATAGGMRAPGAHATPRAPLLAFRPAPRVEPSTPGVGASVFQAILSFYRNVITKVDGDRCDMAPSCSTYSRQALQRHGLLLGVLLTADRLLHEADEIGKVPTMQVGREKAHLDPLEANTYWW